MQCRSRLESSFACVHADWQCLVVYDNGGRLECMQKQTRTSRLEVFKQLGGLVVWSASRADWYRRLTVFKQTGSVWRYTTAVVVWSACRADWLSGSEQAGKESSGGTCQNGG